MRALAQRYESCGFASAPGQTIVHQSGWPSARLSLACYHQAARVQRKRDARCWLHAAPIHPFPARAIRMRCARDARPCVRPQPPVPLRHPIFHPLFHPGLRRPIPPIHTAFPDAQSNRGAAAAGQDHPPMQVVAAWEANTLQEHRLPCTGPLYIASCHLPNSNLATVISSCSVPNGLAIMHSACKRARDRVTRQLS